MQRCDVLLTYEIRNREIENLCLIRRELERRGYSVVMRMQYETFFRTQLPLEARLVVVPAYYRPRARFYSASHTVRTDRILNMMWEQIFSDKSENEDTLHDIKPWGRSVSHIAWGNTTKERLINKYGVNPDHVFMAGHIAQDFLRGDLVRYYDDRQTLFREYGLPTDKRIHLFISSLAVADANIRSIKNATAEGNIERFLRIRDICAETRKELVKWFDMILQEYPDDVIIYRPHPEEKGDSFMQELAERQDRFRIIRDRSVKQWIVACDRIYSWMSTSVAEVYAAGKGCTVLRPVDVPREDDMSMYREVEHVTTYQDFRTAFTADKQKMAVNREDLEKYYYIPEDRYSYELTCDAIEKILRDDRYLLDEPMKNSLAGIINKERIKNVLKRSIVRSAVMKKIHESDHFKKGPFRELLDDVFYVDEKLKKNYTSEEEVQKIIERIDAALADH